MASLFVERRHVHHHLVAVLLLALMVVGFWRANGVDVLPIDAKLEAFDSLLERAPLAGLRDRLEARLSDLDRKASLTHVEQLEHAALARARGDAHAVPSGITRAKDV